MKAPAVSIVLITYNDVARLPRAVDSALGQTLHDLEVIVVDDCSTDETERYVRERMQADARLRYVRLDENSGGCSTPRNTGIEHARGTWLMFCDSDDELERHGAKNLLLAAEQADADLTCGVVERVETSSGDRVRWRVELHEPGVLDGIADRPELVADTVSVNKMYRRSWLRERGITFPDGLLYEDQLFTMRCYAEAARIAVLDLTVYHWSVERAADDLSITQRRHDVRNVRDRIAINRHIDDYLEQHRRHDLQTVKLEKFLRHDLSLHLAPVLDLPDDRAHEVLEILRDYVATLDLRRAAVLRPPLRVALYHLLIDDLVGVRLALRTLRWSAVLPMAVGVVDGRDVWACEHLAGGPSIQELPPAWWLDLDELRPSAARITDQRWCHEVDELDLDGDRLRVRGHTVDAYGQLAEVSDAELVFASGRRRCLSLALSWSLEDGRLTWQGDGALTSIAHLTASDRGSVQLRLRIAGRWTQVPVRVLGTVSRGGTQVALSSADRGLLRWRSLRERRRSFGMVVSRGAAQSLRTLGRWLPTTDLVCFAAQGGTAWTGAPRLLSEALLRDHPEIGQVWALPDGAPDAPPYAAIVQPGGWRHRLAAARAAWIVDDGQALHTGGGSAAPGALAGGRATHTAVVVDPSLQRRGRQRRDWPLLGRRERAARVNADLLAVPSGTDAHDLASAFGFEAAVSVAPPLPMLAREVARERMDLPDEAPVALWASVDGRSLPVEDVARALGRDWRLLVHAPGVRVPAVLTAWVRDVTQEGDIAALVASADVVVTDAAPLGVWAAAASRPVVFYAHDVRDLESRGTGLVIALDDPPGPVVDSAAAVVGVLDDIAADGMRVPASYGTAHARLADLARGDATSTWTAMGWA